MKIIVSLLLVAACHCCLAQIDTNLLATGDWSEPVTDGQGNDTHILRGRLLVYDALDKNTNSAPGVFRWYYHARVYLELQQLKPEHSWADPVEIYYDLNPESYASKDPNVVFKFQHDASGVVTNVIQYKFLKNATGGITNYIELDASAAITNLIHHLPSLNLDVRDGNDKPYPNEMTTINGSFPSPCWVTLPCDATVRLRADIYTLADSEKPNGLEIFVNGGICTIPPNSTNDYYLCGTFSPPTNHPSPLNYHVWQGTLNLPKVKMPPPKQP